MCFTNREAAVQARAAAVALTEAIEHVREHVRADAGSRVGDDQTRAAVEALERQGHAPPGGAPAA